MELSVCLEKKLRNFTLEVDFTVKDEVFALLGASGCGKSMTLRCIAGIEKPDKGRIVLEGKTLFDSERGIHLPPQARQLGFLFQDYALFPNMTVAENLAFVMAGSKGEKGERIRELLQRFRLAEVADCYPPVLSGGQQQRAAFARILASPARLLLLDEPFSALDSYLKWQLEMELMELLPAYGGTALLVSHDRGEVYRLARRVAVLNRGKMEPPAPKKELFRQPRTLAATLLTGCKNISAARKIDEAHIQATDWGLTLKTGEAPSPSVRYAGIRAHFLEPREGAGEDEENVFPMEVMRVIEDTFSYIVMVKPRGQEVPPLRWELEKKDWRQLAGRELFLCFPPEKLMLLES